MQCQSTTQKKQRKNGSKSPKAKRKPQGKYWNEGRKNEKNNTNYKQKKL